MIKKMASFWIQHDSIQWNLKKKKIHNFSRWYDFLPFYTKYQIELTCNCRIGITSIFMVIPLTPLTIKKFIAKDLVFLHELICRKGQMMIPMQSVDIKLHGRRQSIDVYVLPLHILNEWNKIGNKMDRSIYLQTRVTFFQTVFKSRIKRNKLQSWPVEILDWLKLE